MKSNRRAIVLVTIAAVVALCFGGIVYSWGGENADQAAKAQAAAELEEAIANASMDDPYVCDEVCLSCHGGTYQALEELTAEYGDSNPHGGTHGSGGMNCDACHVNGSQVPTDEENKCLDCHAWPRPEQTLIKYMDL